MGGGKRSWSKVLPPVSPWSACFSSLFFRSSNFEFPARIRKGGGGRPTGPPIVVFRVQEMESTGEVAALVMLVLSVNQNDWALEMSYK